MSQCGLHDSTQKYDKKFNFHSNSHLQKIPDSNLELFLAGDFVNQTSTVYNKQENFLSALQCCQTNFCSTKLRFINETNSILNNEIRKFSKAYPSLLVKLLDTTTKDIYSQENSSKKYVDSKNSINYAHIQKIKNSQKKSNVDFENISSSPVKGEYENPLADPGLNDSQNINILGKPVQISEKYLLTLLISVFVAFILIVLFVRYYFKISKKSSDKLQNNRKTNVELRSFIPTDQNILQEFSDSGSGRKIGQTVSNNIQSDPSPTYSRNTAGELRTTLFTRKNSTTFCAPIFENTEQQNNQQIENYVRQKSRLSYIKNPTIIGTDGPTTPNLSVIIPRTINNSICAGTISTSLWANSTETGKKSLASSILDNIHSRTRSPILPQNNFVTREIQNEENSICQQIENWEPLDSNFMGSWNGDRVFIKKYSEKKFWENSTNLFQDLNLRSEFIVNFIAGDFNVRSSGFVKITSFYPELDLQTFLTKKLKNLKNAENVKQELKSSILSGLYFLQNPVTGSSYGNRPAIAHNCLNVRNILVKNGHTGQAVISNFDVAVYDKNYNSRNETDFIQLNIEQLREKNVHKSGFTGIQLRQILEDKSLSLAPLKILLANDMFSCNKKNSKRLGEERKGRGKRGGTGRGGCNMYCTLQKSVPLLGKT